VFFPLLKIFEETNSQALIKSVAKSLRKISPRPIAFVRNSSDVVWQFLANK